MKHTPLHQFCILMLGVVVMVFASCACGNAEGTSCSNAAGCPAGYACASGKCTTAKGPDGGPLVGGTGGSSGTGGSAGTGGGSTGPCVGLQCRQVACPGGQTTSISGTVYAPNKTLPLYNAVVYVPNTDLQPFTAGVSCDKCGANLSGSPIVQKLTDVKGGFRLENVPAGDSVPLVIQVGRWRRRITIPNVKQCEDTALSAEQTHLPRNKAEGDMPQMAISTGKSDAFECLLKKIGIDDAEVTTDAKDGRVHYFRYNGIPLEGGSPNGNQLVASVANLKKYDVVMLPCEGNPNFKQQNEIQNLVDYANLGGRVFATHYSYSWVQNGLAMWPQTAQWRRNPQSFEPNDPQPYSLDTSFAKGTAFAEWLVNVNASTTKGVLSVVESRTNVVSVNSAVAQRWAYSDALQTVGHYTFNTPVAALLPDGGAPDQCGRVVFSDFHVAANALSGLPTYPASCNSGEMTAQEKALAFMFFDLSGCVQRDEVPPDIN